MQKLIKIAIVAGVLGYVVWPVDLMPGVLLDDLVIAAFGLAGLMASKRRVSVQNPDT